MLRLINGSGTVTTVTTHNGEMTCRDWGHGHGLCLIPFLISLFRLLLVLLVLRPPSSHSTRKTTHSFNLKRLPRLFSSHFATNLYTLLQSKALFVSSFLSSSLFEPAPALRSRSLTLYDRVDHLLLLVLISCRLIQVLFSSSISKIQTSPPKQTLYIRPRALVDLRIYHSRLDFATFSLLTYHDSLGHHRRIDCPDFHLRYDTNNFRR